MLLFVRQCVASCHFEDNNWISQLAYLVESQSARQGHYDFKTLTRVGGFLKKAELWKRLCAEGDFSCFPQFDSFVVSENMERDTVKTFLDGHLANVISSLSCLVAL